MRTVMYVTNEDSTMQRNDTQPEKKEEFKIPPEFADNIAFAHNQLDYAGLANQENDKLLIQYAEFADKIGAALMQLIRVGLANQENFKLLIQHAKYGFWIGVGINKLTP